MIAACDWDHPGADRYTGEVAAAIYRIEAIPAPVRLLLIDRAERHAFSDVVVIDRDSIRGRVGEYDPRIRFMAFGSAGQQCAEVTRSGWDEQHVEQALAYCAEGWCVAVPAACGNVFLLTRREPDARIDAPADEIAPPAGPAASEVRTYVEQPEAPSRGDFPIEEAGGLGGWAVHEGFPVAIPTIWGPGPCCVCPPELPPIAAIPEPPAWAYLLAGALLGLYAHRIGRR